MSIKDFVERFPKKIEWTEVIKDGAHIPAPEMILNPDCYEVRELDHGLGCGVFARLPIPKGTIIAQYTGELKNKQTVLRQFFEYGVGWACGDQIIDGGKIGNITRFINHFPQGHESTLVYRNSPDMIDYNSEVATQNIYMDENMVCRTEREILAGEQLGFDYGDKYWNALSSRPMFFLKSCSSRILQCDAETCTQPGIWRCKKC